KKIVLLQDNFLAMKELLLPDWRRLAKRILHLGRDPWESALKAQAEALRGADAIVAVSKDVADWYEIKDPEIIPIGTDTNLFKPLGTQKELRRKYDLPADKRIKIFVGSTHPVK